MNKATRLKKLEGRMAKLTVLIPKLTITNKEGSEAATYTCGDYSHSEPLRPGADASEFSARFEANALAGAQAAYPGAIILSLGAEDL